MNIDRNKRSDSYKFPEYTGVVVLSADMLLVIHSNAFTLRLHSCHSGHLLATSDRLQARPYDVCVVDRSGYEIAVTLGNAKIEILLVESTCQSAAIKRVRTLDVKGEFDYCHGVTALRLGKNLVVSGGKEDKDAQGDWICWGLVSHFDGHVGTVHKICKSGGSSYGSSSYLATSADDSVVYISCWTGPYYPKNNGVYEFDVKSGKYRFKYYNRDLAIPKGISVDRRGFIYVCNWDPPCIHQLTEKMEPVTIHRNGMPSEPLAMDWEEKQEELYMTRMRSKEVWRICPQWSDPEVILIKNSRQESSSSSGENFLVLGQPKVLSDEEVVHLWAKENGIDARALDELLKAGFTSFKALKLLEPNDLVDTMIPLGQKKLIIESVKELIKKGNTQVQSIQLEDMNTLLVLDSQDDRQSRTQQESDTRMNLVASVYHQPLTAFSLGIENPHTHAISDTRCIYQVAPPDCASVGPSSTLSTQVLEHVGPLQSSLHDEMETLSLKDPQSNPQSAASGEYKATEVLVSDKREPVIEETSTQIKQGNITAPVKVEVTLPTTSAPAAAAKEQPETSNFWGSLQKFFMPERTKEIREITSATSMTGVHALPAADQPKTKRKLGLLSWIKKKVGRDELATPSTLKSFGEKVADVDTEKVNNLQSRVETEMPPSVLVPGHSEDAQQDHVVPVEILRMDDKSIQLYKKALRDGKEKVYNIRLMVVGQYGVGKTTLTKRLLGQQVDILERKSTEGINVHQHCCKVSLDTGEWIVQHEDENLSRLQRLLKLLTGPGHKPDVSQEQADHEEVIYQREAASELDTTNTSAGFDQEIQLTSQAAGLSIIMDACHGEAHTGQSISNVVIPLHEGMPNEGEKKTDTVMEVLHLLNENSDKLEYSTVKYATLSVWDFAGQYIFYTTHQAFLTSRAIYLLVIDLSQQVTDLIKDDIFFLDSNGIKLHTVHDQVEIWLNSIHSCSPSPETSIPVILVGTHVDKLSEVSRKEVIDKYFKTLRYMLRDKPTICHLMDDIAIDNTQTDPLLEVLKRRIFELTSQQPHWGQEIPARWLTLEQMLMTLKASGIKVVPMSLIEEINMSGSVRIEDRNELELFLRFHHEMGTILYFSVEELKDKIVLDPQWLIDALKSLITAEIFICAKYHAIRSKWFEFSTLGKLTHELIDAIWTKERNPEFHDNKEHILLLMEHLNIIVKPRVYIEEGREIKEENYFLAPCMLQQETPEEVIYPGPNDCMESSPVLCYVFLGKFLPPAIFHRLLAACVAHWQLATKKKEQMQENLIFCGCCVFQLDQYHKLTLHFREYVIFVRVTRMGIMYKTPSSKLCIEVREFITLSLDKIIGYLGQSLKFEYFIQCPEYSGVSINSLIPVSLLKENAEVHCNFHGNIIESYKVLNLWFEDQEQSGDSDASSAGPMPPQSTSDTDRFMRIVYLLVDVGSRVLRQLLCHHTVTSTCTLDQYLAKHRNIINNLRRVFNPSQMDIMFPPNGDDTNPDDYDITLLSALFNTIVPTLSRQEKDMIKSLREDRNRLFGHAKSCQINASDFQIYWSDISSTLITLSQQCGDTAFEFEILQEIQRTKISAVPAGSYPDILKTWFNRIESVKDELQNLTSRLQALESKEKSFSSES